MSIPWPNRQKSKGAVCVFSKPCFVSFFRVLWWCDDWRVEYVDIFFQKTNIYVYIYIHVRIYLWCARKKTIYIYIFFFFFGGDPSCVVSWIRINIGFHSGETIVSRSHHLAHASTTLERDCATWSQFFPKKVMEIVKIQEDPPIHSTNGVSQNKHHGRGKKICIEALLVESQHRKVSKELLQPFWLDSRSVSFYWLLPRTRTLSWQWVQTDINRIFSE